MPHRATRPFYSPLRFGFQQRQQFVGRPELALSKTGRHNRLNRFQLFCRICPNVDLRRGQITVSNQRETLRTSWVACSTIMAQVCLSTWGDTLLPCSVEHFRFAVLT